MNRQNLKPFKPGYDKRRLNNGRPKKLMTNLKAEGYKLSQIEDCFRNILAMTKNELTEIQKDKSGKYTILELTLTSALLKDIRCGRMDSLELILDRVFGQSVVKIESVPEQSLFPDVINKVS